MAVKREADIEQRVRRLIERLENYTPPTPSHPDPEVDHWFACGLDEAYDNVLDWLYTDVLQEER